jgi:RNA recognition motif-containing protein
MSDAERLKATVYVGGLDLHVTQRILQDAFIPFGDIVDIQLPKPELASSTDAHRGFGYVEFEVADDAREAIDNMDQSELFGRVIRVAPAKPQKDQSEGLGSKTALWEKVCADVSLMGTMLIDDRNHGSQKMQLTKRAVMQLLKLQCKMKKRWIPCKGWINLMLQDLRWNELSILG